MERPKVEIVSRKKLSFDDVETENNNDSTQDTESIQSASFFGNVRKNLFETSPLDILQQNKFWSSPRSEREVFFMSPDSKS